MRISTTPQGNTRIRFDRCDGYDFANRPGRAWPASTLLDGPDNKLIELDADGDLVDSSHIPNDTPANELSAFIEYALSEARSQIDELLTIEERKQAVGGSR